jgi:modification methylase
MISKHKIFKSDSRNLDFIHDNSIDLVVTSPPYPMIEMWDHIFSKMNEKIGISITKGEGKKAFELMHKELDKVWIEVFRVLKQGGIACINIGDATRTINESFQLYTNHSRILNKFIELGFDNLPNILWRKQTNSPNKFMGSGMYPIGAYVTLEHEYILVFRKGERRKFIDKDEKLRRQESAFFWEERNIWFSDVWELKGTKQKLHAKERSRERSGAYPFELAYRLINMFSIKFDIVLDPFLGTGTTTFASIATGRNSIGVDKDNSLINSIKKCFNNDYILALNSIVSERLTKHLKFVDTSKTKNGDEFKYLSEYYNFPLKTKQELKIKLDYIEEIENISEELIVKYNSIPSLDYSNHEDLFGVNSFLSK